VNQVRNAIQNFGSTIRWDLVKKVLTAVFFAAFAYLLIGKARSMDWGKVWDTFTQTSAVTLVIAFGLGFVCYTAYASYDLIGRYIFKAKVSVPKSLVIAWVSYASNLNFGALIGSVALRYRLYSRVGLDFKTVTKILSVSVFSNWVGYILLAGLLFLLGGFSPPKSWPLGSVGFRLLGAIFLLVVAVYIGCCAWMNDREFNIRGRTLVLPKLPVVAWQFGIAMVHWTLMAVVIYQFFSYSTDFATVYITLLLSCIAGALLNVPSGLGIVETIFVVMLSDKMPDYEIIANIFSYRVVFYLVPLAIALPTYIAFETMLKKRIV